MRTSRGQVGKQVPLPIAFTQLVLAHPLILAAAALTVVAAPVSMLGDGLSRGALLASFAFFALIFVGELARVALPGDREAAPLASAGALGFALVSRVGEVTVTHAVVVTIAVTAFATGAAAVTHASVGRNPRLDNVARRILVVGAAAQLLVLADRLFPSAPNSVERVLVLVGVATTAGLIDLILAAFDRCWRLRASFVAAVRSELQLMVGLGTAIAATGVLIALAAHEMGLWALPALSLPLLVTQFAFRRYAGIRATYGQTIRALSRITEVGGYVVPGHAERVTDLAVATGRILGMTEDELLDLEYAALLHDVGQISLDDPIPRGNTLTVTPQHRSRIAGLGADIIRSSGFLDRVATIVERQAEPYRRTRRDTDDTVPLGSRIIKAVSAYDDLVTDGGGDKRAAGDALERLRLGMAYEYDPRVVAALAEAVGRSGA